jgi:UDP-galactopyranose mutase
MKKAIIIGGGIGGCVAAIELNSSGWDVEIIEASAQLGAGLRTHRIGGHPCTFGPRHFLTHNESTFAYVNKLVPLRSCKDHQFLSYIEHDSEFYNYPIHIDDVDRMPESGKIHGELNGLEAGFRDREFKLTSGTSFADSEKPPADYKEFWLRSIGPTLYDKFISSYTRKMWLVEDEAVISDFTWSPKGVAIKRGPREGWDTVISAYPQELNGYDPIFDLAESVAIVRFNSVVDDIDIDKREVRIGSNVLKADLIINSAPIDLAFGKRYGELKYIGRDIVYFVLPIEYALPKDVYFTYYCGSERYTRIVEYKKFTRYKSPHTLLSLEFPSMNGRYYPLPVRDQQDIARRYLDDLSNDVFSIGRLGRYNYRYDIDDAVDQALEIVRGL